MSDTPTADGGPIYDTVSRILGRFVRAEVPLRPDTELVRDLGIDSLAAMNIVMEIEDAYAFDVPLAEVGTIRTVQDLVDLIARHATPT
jgi:acyl carrier protein